MEAAGPVQRTEQSLKTLTGSAKEAARVMEELRLQSRKTGADLEGSSSTTKRFIALGFSPDEALKLNRSILDVAGAVGMTRTEATLLGAALAQVQAKGTVSMEELRQQIAEKGVPVIEELAKKLGVSTGALIKMVEQGKVKSKELIDIFMNMEGGFARFRGGAEAMTKTLPGAIDRLKAVWNDLLIDIGKPVNEAITPFINGLSNMLEKLKPFAVEFGTMVGNAFKILYQSIADGSIGQLLALVLLAGYEQATAWMIELHIRAITTIGGFMLQMMVQAVTLPVTLFAQLFSAAVNLVVGLFTGNLNTGISTSAQTMASGFGAVVKYIGVSIYNEFGQACENVANSFLKAMLAVVNAISGAINSILDTARNVPGVEKLIGPKGSGGLPKIDAQLDFFTPQALPDLNKAVNDMVGTAFRDKLGEFGKDKLADWNKQFGPGPDNPQKVEKPIQDDLSAAGDKASKERKKRLKDERSEVQKLIDDWTDMSKQMDHLIVGVAQSLSQNLTDGIMSVIDGTKSLKDAFTDMANSIIADIIRQIIQMYIQLAVATALRAVMGTAHTGGVAGSPSMTQTGGSTVSAGVPTHHVGGVTGNTAEAMVKVDRGETILTRRRAEEVEERLRRAKGGETGRRDSGKGTTILNVLDPSHVADAIAANPDIIVNAMSKRLPQVRRLATSKERP
jgi:tape measure domain-containing protein